LLDGEASLNVDDARDSTEDMRSSGYKTIGLNGLYYKENIKE